jgi:ATP-dependent protease ClpP protease subunit
MKKVYTKSPNVKPISLDFFKFSKSHDESEEGEHMMQFPMQISNIVQKAEMHRTMYTINIDSDIEDQEKYRSVLQTLREAQPDDMVVFRISSDGGDLDILLSLYNAILDCSSETIVADLYKGYSAAAMLFLVCPQTVVNKHASIMIHSATFFSGGKQSEIVDHVKYTKVWLEDLANDIYEGFLTSEEIVKCIEGKEYWFNEEEIKKRLENRNKYFEKKNKEAESKKEVMVDESVSKPKSSRKKK